jgi:hypothetical protein
MTERRKKEGKKLISKRTATIRASRKGANQVSHLCPLMVL